jgi:hypothetical protein
LHILVRNERVHHLPVVDVSVGAAGFEIAKNITRGSHRIIRSAQIDEPVRRILIRVKKAQRFAKGERNANLSPTGHNVRLDESHLLGKCDPIQRCFRKVVMAGDWSPRVQLIQSLRQSPELRRLVVRK